MELFIGLAIIAAVDFTVAAIFGYRARRQSEKE